MKTSSLDTELLCQRRIYQLPHDVRNFLLEGDDLNFYYYANEETSRDTSLKNIQRSLSNLRLISGPSRFSDEHCVRVVTDRVLNHWQDPSRRQQLEEIVRLLWNPENFADSLDRAPAENFQEVVQILISLLHSIPQSPQVGILRQVSSLFGTRNGSKIIGSDGDWESLRSTLVLLRPLEYFFQIGSPEARSVEVNVLHSRSGFLLGVVLNFSGREIPSDYFRKLEVLIENIRVQELAGALNAGPTSESPLQKLGRVIFKCLPVHSTFHWEVDRSCANLRQAHGLPLSERTDDFLSVLAQATPLDTVPGIYRTWLESNACNALAAGAIESGLGWFSALPLPPWPFAGNSRHPLDPKLLVTLVAHDKREVLQVLMPELANLEPGDQRNASSLAEALESAQLRRIEFTHSDRFPSKAPDLPSGWIYHSDTAHQIRLTIEAFRKYWQGENVDVPPVLLLLSGPPGTGKSEFAEWIGRAVVGDPDPETIYAGALKSPEPGETERRILDVVNGLHSMKPRVVIIDEIEQLAQDTTDSVQRTFTAAFKSAADYLLRSASNGSRSRGVLIVTINDRSVLDRAILSKATEIVFRWGRDETLALIGLRSKLPWEEMAAKQVDSMDPREVLRIIGRAESEAKKGRSLLAHSALTVNVNNVQSAARNKAEEDETNVRPSEVGALLPMQELTEFSRYLSEILDLARLNKIFDPKEFHAATKSLFPMDANKLALMRRFFPSWSQKLDTIFRANRDRPTILE